MMYSDEDFIQEVTEAVNKGLIVPYATERLLRIISQQKEDVERFKADKAVYAAEHEQLERNFQSAKAEIASLDTLNTDIFAANVVLQIKLEKAKAEAIKGFAERLKRNHITKDDKGKVHLLIAYDEFDNLVKEMVGDIPKLEHNSLCETETYRMGE